MRAAIGAALLLAAAPVQAAEGDRLFDSHCASCHGIRSDAPPGPGPNLAGLAGRVVAGDPRFDYSPALREGRAEGRAWDASALRDFLRDPDAAFPGTWMSETGLRGEDDITALAAFLLRRP